MIFMSIKTEIKQDGLGPSRNKDEEKLMVLAIGLVDDEVVITPLDVEHEHDVRDKIIILKANRVEMPMPTGTPELDAAFWNTLVGELPAFLYAVQEWKIPEEIQDPRYGIRAYHHPEIVAKLEQTAPELRLMELIDRAIFRGSAAPLDENGRMPAFSGSALELEAHLVRANGPVQYEARNLLTWQNSTGTYLGRLKDSSVAHVQGRVSCRTRNGQTIWTIQPPVQEPAPVVEPSHDAGPPKVPEGIGEAKN